MNILKHRICHQLTRSLIKTPSYQVFMYLKDHDQKVNPKQNRLKLSYMDPKLQTDIAPSHPRFSAVLRKGARQQLQRRLFQSYKQKILEGKVDEQQVIQPDTLWGDKQKPAHYYRQLSNTQISKLSHSIIKDVQHFREQLILPYLQQGKKINDISQVKDINDLACLAVNYRLNNIQGRQKYFQIQKAIGNKFHLLSNKSLIYLKYAFLTSPKKCTPQFNRIINDLLVQSIGQFSATDLINLIYFNRFDHFRFHKDNLQIIALQQVSKHFEKMSLQQKINFLFLYIDSRGPTIRPQAQHRNFNQIRNKTQQIIYFLNLNGDFSSLSEQLILRLTYCLVRAKTNVTQFITDQITQYIQNNFDKITNKNLVIFFDYLTKIQANKSITNLQLMKKLKQKIISLWSQYSSVEQIRALDGMYTLNLYNEACHELYTAIPIQADSTLLGHICRIQMMNSSGRQWQVIHRLVDLDYIPLNHFKDCKRFYNYVRAIAPDWDLQPLQKKLKNTEIFFDSSRQQSFSMDKKFYRGLKQFLKFASLKGLPHNFILGQPINNVQFGEFLLPEYQISLDVVTDVERIRGTTDLKGSYQRKIKSLESLGWKHLYVLEEDIQKITPLQFFDYINSVCQPHFQQQLKLIASFDQYRSYQIDQLRQKQILTLLKNRQLQHYLKLGDLSLVKQEQQYLQEIKQQQQKKYQALSNTHQLASGQPIPQPGQF